MVMVAPFYYYFSRYGVDLTRFVGGGMNVGGVVRDSFVIYCNITSESAILIFSFLFILAVSVSCYPAAKAALTVPIKTIRES
jgi:ABC-type lipoprotein release transport system permease subunit